MTAEPTPDAAARIAALHQHGADRVDPVRLRLVEAMARRAQTQAEPVRLLLSARLAGLLDELEQGLTASDAGSAPADQTAAPEQLSPAAGSLAALLAYLAQHVGESGMGEQPGLLPRGPGATPELKALSAFRGDWVRLGVEQQFKGALAQVPDNAGPLNAHRLVVQALTQMRELSPGYLRHFLAYANTLLWLEQAETSRIAAQKAAADAEKRPAKPPRGKARIA